jgi:hypothetical protein
MRLWIAGRDWIMSSTERKKARLNAMVQSLRNGLVNAAIKAQSDFFCSNTVAAVMKSNVSSFRLRCYNTAC